MPTSNYSRTGNSNSGSPVSDVTARRTSWIVRACTLFSSPCGHVWRAWVSALEPPRLKLLLIVFDLKGARLLPRRPVSGVKMRSMESKDSPSATRNIESNVASSSRCRRYPLQKNLPACVSRSSRWVWEVHVSTDARRACSCGVNGSTMGAYPRSTGSNPVERNGLFPP